MARMSASATNRELVERMDIRIAQHEQKLERMDLQIAKNAQMIERMDLQIANNEQNQRELEKRWIEDRRLIMEIVRDMKQDSKAMETRLIAGFQDLTTRVDNMKWWILGVCLTTVIAVAAMVISMVFAT